MSGGLLIIADDHRLPDDRRLSYHRMRSDDLQGPTDGQLGQLLGIHLLRTSGRSAPTATGLVPRDLRVRLSSAFDLRSNRHEPGN